MNAPVHDPPELITITIPCPRQECVKGQVERTATVRPWSDDPYEYVMQACPTCQGNAEIEIEVCSRCEREEYARGNQPACDCWNQDEMALQDVHELVIGR